MDSHIPFFFRVIFNFFFFPSLLMTQILFSLWKLLAYFLWYGLMCDALESAVIGMARFQSIFSLFCWKKRKDSGPPSEATQVIFSFLTILFHGSFMHFSSALTWWFWHFSYTLLVFLLTEELPCLLPIVWGFSWFCNLDSDPKYLW